jgi:hypothetical protein
VKCHKTPSKFYLISNADLSYTEGVGPRIYMSSGFRFTRRASELNVRPRTPLNGYRAFQGLIDRSKRRFTFAAPRIFSLTASQTVEAHV